jgi:hypothetical protein
LCIIKNPLKRPLSGLFSDGVVPVFYENLLICDLRTKKKGLLAHLWESVEGKVLRTVEEIIDFPLFTFISNGILLVSSIRSRAFDIPVGE